MTRSFATTEGLGRDNSDKGYNKASTAAFKNLLLRLLCIGDPRDDTDGHVVELDTPKSHADEMNNMFAAINDDGFRRMRSPGSRWSSLSRRTSCQLTGTTRP